MSLGCLVKNSLAKTLLREKFQVRKKSTPRVTNIWYNNQSNWSSFWDEIHSTCLVSLLLIVVQVCRRRPIGTGHPNLLSFFLALLTILQTRSPFTNDHGHKFAFYLLATLYLTTMLRICALSLNSGSRSRWMQIFWQFWSRSYSFRRRDGS